MEEYDWQKNQAVVQRMYYSERTLQTTTGFALAFTATNMLYIKKNYFAELARSRIFPTWKYWAIFNSVVIGLLLRPLTVPEIKQQWRKRRVMGKYLYSLYHLDPIEEFQ